MIIEISGIVTTNNIDLESSKFTLACIRDMVTQLKNIELYLNHKRKYALPVGKAVAQQITKKGLLINFVLDPESPRFLQTVAAISREIITGFSIAYRIKECHSTKKIKIINKVELIEISLAKKPINIYCVFNRESVEKLRLMEKELLGRL